MRKLAFAVAVLFVCHGTASAQTAWADKLFDNKTVHDFGNVARGTQLKFAFRMKNIYAVPLKITDVRVTCGCLTATPALREIKPQQETTIDVIMDARKFTGQKTIKVFITVGPEYISTATLTVSANARTDVVFNPGEFNFGVVMQGQQAVQVVDVDYAGFLDFRVKEVVKPADAPFSVTVEEKFRKGPFSNQAGAVRYQMTVKLNPDAPAGAFNHELILKTNDPQGENLSVNVAGNVQASLSVAPTTVNLGTVKINEPKQFKVQVRGNRPFKITDIRSDAKDIIAELPGVAAQAHTVTLRIQPTAPGLFTRQVTIVTDLEKNASVTVTVTGTAGS